MLTVPGPCLSPWWHLEDSYRCGRLASYEHWCGRKSRLWGPDETRCVLTRPLTGVRIRTPSSPSESRNSLPCSPPSETCGEDRATQGLVPMTGPLQPTPLPRCEAAVEKPGMGGSTHDHVCSLFFRVSNLHSVRKKEPRCPRRVTVK